MVGVSYDEIWVALCGHIVQLEQSNKTVNVWHIILFCINWRNV